MTRDSIDYLHGKGRLARWRALLRLIGSKRFRLRVPVRSMLFSRNPQLK